MKANYHTHSKWCHHGEGEIYEFVEEALRLNFEELAITEHVPQIDRFTWMSQEEFLEFDKDLNSCVEKYADRIRVIKGFECEYLPKLMDLYKRYKDKYGYELFIMGQHFAGDDGEINMFSPKGEDGIKRYCADVIKGLETGFFSILAHPDLCLIDYKPGWDKVCEQGFEEVFTACRELDIPVEFNINGYRYNKAYPNMQCWEMVKKYDLKVMIGSDAHAPNLLYDEAVQRAEKLLDEKGIKVTPKLEVIR